MATEREIGGLRTKAFKISDDLHNWWREISAGIKSSKLESFESWLVLRSSCIPSISTVPHGVQLESLWGKRHSAQLGILSCTRSKNIAMHFHIFPYSLIVLASNMRRVVGVVQCVFMRDSTFQHRAVNCLQPDEEVNELIRKLAVRCSLKKVSSKSSQHR